jgi:hypothetical protein
MGIPPVCRPLGRMLITLYCNPFFAPCKEKNYENPGFFQDIFYYVQNLTKSAGKQFPERGKKRVQDASENAVPKNDARKQRERITHPGIPAAQPEA